MGKKNKGKSKSQKQRAKKRKGGEAPKPQETSAEPESGTQRAAAKVFTPDEASPSVEEHRAAPRVALQVEIHLASDSHFFSGLSGDLSEGGVFVSTYRDLSIGHGVDLEFLLPGSDIVIHAHGVVRWHRDGTAHGPPGVGIAFEGVSLEDKKLIHKFCRVRPPLYYDNVG